MRMEHNHRRQEDYFPMAVKKMEIWKKLLYAVFICILAYLINSGDPKKNSIAKHYQITDQKIQYIFETTIAIETKTIKQRISEQNTGVWSYILSKNWADIEVQLKTRIGIKLNSITYDSLTDNVHINFGDLCILDRALKTRTLKTSDNFIKWSIQSYQKHKEIFEQELVNRQSKQIIKYFQSNDKKMQELQNQYYGKIMKALQYNTSQFSVQFNIFKLNQLVLFYVGKAIPQTYFNAIKKTYQYEKPIKPYLAIQNKELAPDNFLSGKKQMIEELQKQEQTILEAPIKRQIRETVKLLQGNLTQIGNKSKIEASSNMNRIQSSHQKAKQRIFKKSR